MTSNDIKYGIGKLIIDIKRHKHVTRIDIYNIKIGRFSIKMLINDFKLKKLCNRNSLQ